MSGGRRGCDRPQRERRVCEECGENELIAISSGKTVCLTASKGGTTRGEGRRG